MHTRLDAWVLLSLSIAGPADCVKAYKLNLLLARFPVDLHGRDNCLHFGPLTFAPQRAAPSKDSHPERKEEGIMHDLKKKLPKGPTTSFHPHLLAVCCCTMWQRACIHLERTKPPRSSTCAKFSFGKATGPDSVQTMLAPRPKTGEFKSVNSRWEQRTVSDSITSKAWVGKLLPWSSQQPCDWKAALLVGRGSEAARQVSQRHGR